MADTLAMPSYLHLSLPIDTYTMVQFHEEYKQLCCGSRVEVARKTLGRVSPGIFDSRVAVSLCVGWLSSSCLLFSERSLFAHHLAAHHLLGAKEHPRKALPVLMLTALKNPMKAGFFKAKWAKFPERNTQSNGPEWLNLYKPNKVREPEPGRIFEPCSKEGLHCNRKLVGIQLICRNKELMVSQLGSSWSCP